MTKDVINLTYPLSSISEPRSRRALTESFGNGSKGLMATELLVYLVLNYLAMLKNHRALLDSYDGYMAKSVADINFNTGLCKDSIKLGLLALEKTGLISVKKGGLDNKTCIKVNVIETEAYLFSAQQEWDKKYEEYLADCEKKKKDRLDRRANNIAKGKSKPGTMCKILNGISDRADAQTVKRALSGTIYENGWIYFWLFSYYYFRYTGEPYVWYPEALETLCEIWSRKGFRPETERAMSAAIKYALDIPEFAPKEDRKFEIRFRHGYNPGPGCDYPGMYYDDLLGQRNQWI